MSFSRFQKATSQNIVYKDQHEKLSPDELNDVANQDKLLYNNEGTLEWKGFNGALEPVRTDATGKIPAELIVDLFNDVLVYANYAAFPATGETGKYFIDGSGPNKAYIWTGSAYLLLTDLSAYFNMIESDARFTRLAAANNMTDGSISNLTSLSVASSISCDNLGVNTSVPVNMGWNNLNFCAQVNDKLKLDETNTKLLTNLNSNSHDITSVNALTCVTGNIGTLQNGASAVVLGANLTGNSKTITSLSNVTSTAGTITTLGATTFTATTSNLGSLGSNVTGNSKTITGLADIGSTTGTITTLGSTTGTIATLNSTTANIGTLQNGASPVVLGSNITGNSKTITGVSTLGATTANIGTLANSASNITLGDNVTGNSKTITGLSSIGATSGTITTLGANIGTLANSASNITLGDKC
jgi:hypothetical protein